MKPYYYVYRLPGGRGPVIKHSTAEEAVAKSQRLSAQHPGDTFEILKCVAITRTTEPSTFWNDGESPPPRYRYFRAADCACIWRVSPTGVVQVASTYDPEWEPSCCSAADFSNGEAEEISVAQLPDPVKP